MKIKYPKLVEDAFKVASQHGQIDPSKVNDVKSQIYRAMVERGVLSELGEPTQLAVQMGIAGGLDPVADESHAEISLAEFKREWPIYAEFEDSHFLLIDGEWMADAYVIKVLAYRKLDDPNGTPEERLEAEKMIRKIDDSNAE